MAVDISFFNKYVVIRRVTLELWKTANTLFSGTYKKEHGSQWKGSGDKKNSVCVEKVARSLSTVLKAVKRKGVDREWLAYITEMLVDSYYGETVIIRNSYPLHIAVLFTGHAMKT